MNAERCLLAGEALGLGYAALKKFATRSKHPNAAPNITSNNLPDQQTTPANASSSPDP